MTLLCVFFALLDTLSPLGVAAVVFVIISVLAHVAGNYLGTQLRESGNRRFGQERVAPHGASTDIASADIAAAAAPPSQLRSRTPLGLLVLIITATGVLIGGMAGGFGTAWANGEKAAALNIAVGAAAFAVLGGIGAFLIASFLRVMFGAWRQAHQHSRRPRD